MKILIIDNYDSFTYNLYQAVGELLESIKGKAGSVKNSLDVFRNNEITLGQIKKRKYDRIILSPGPGNPADRAYFGVCADILQKVHTIPVLGVCLGMQGMAHYFGGKVTRADRMMHGKTSQIMHDGKGIFANVPQEIEVMRYHSLVVEKESLPKELEITAIVKYRGPATPHPRSTSSITSFSPGAQRGTPSRVTPCRQRVEVMGIRHKKFPIVGVQFHPESFATESGKQMLQNFLFGGSI